MRESFKKLRMDIRGRVLKSTGSVDYRYLRNQTLINDGTRKVYIATPKCACTSFKASIVFPDNEKSGKSLEVHKFARENSRFSAQAYTQNQLFDIYKNYEIISLWRDPMARFRSAMIDKVINLNRNENRGTIKDIRHHVKRYATHRVYTYWEQSIFEDKYEKSQDLMDELLYQVGNGILNSSDYELNPHFASQAYCQRLDLISSGRRNYKISSLLLALDDFMEGTECKIFELNRIPGQFFHEIEVLNQMNEAVEQRFSTDCVIYEKAL